MAAMASDQTESNESTELTKEKITQLWHLKIKKRLAKLKKRQQEPFEELLDTLRSKCSSVRGLESKVRSLQSHITEIIVVKDQYKDQVDILNENLMKKQELNENELFELLQNKSKTVQELEGKLKSLQDQVTEVLVIRDQFKREIDILTEKVARKQELNEQLELAVRTLTDEKESLRKELLGVKEGNKTLLQEYTIVKEKLNELERASAQMFTHRLSRQSTTSTVSTGDENSSSIAEEDEQEDEVEPYLQPRNKRLSLPRFTNSIWKQLSRSTVNLSNSISRKSSVDYQINASPEPVEISISSVPCRAIFNRPSATYEVSALKWISRTDSPTNDFNSVLTGGTDNNVRLCSFDSYIFSLIEKTLFTGANGTITGIDYKDNYVVASSTDGSCRLWTRDGRLHTTLSGHTNKVLAAKFIGTCKKVVSGSHDQTIKLWDVHNNSCVSTLPANSSCNDLAVGSIIVSCHMDRKIRIWDLRVDQFSKVAEQAFDGRVTSVCLSLDGTKVLASVRDGLLVLVDLRVNQVVQNCTSDGFKVTNDWSRACLSPDSQYAAAGSADGCLYVWSTLTGDLEARLSNSPSGRGITACAWDFSGQNIMSCDRSSKLTVWG